MLHGKTIFKDQNSNSFTSDIFGQRVMKHLRHYRMDYLPVLGTRGQCLLKIVGASFEIKTHSEGKDYRYKISFVGCCHEPYEYYTGMTKRCSWEMLYL